MLPDQASKPGPPTYKSGALPIKLRGPATSREACKQEVTTVVFLCKRLKVMEKKSELIIHFEHPNFEHKHFT